MKYQVTPAVSAAMDAVLGPRFPFAYEEDGVLIHDTDLVELWPPGDSPDLDAATRDALLADSYADLLATLAPAKDRRCRIYSFLPHGEVSDPLTPPKSVDYRVAPQPRLHRQRTFVKGVLVRVVYYAEATANPDGSLAFSNPVVEEVYDYIRDAGSFAQERTLTITWYRGDGTPHPDVKTLRKLYDRQDSLREGKRRRRNVVDSLEGGVARLLLASAAPGQEQAALDTGRAFVAKYRAEIDNFIEGGSKDLEKAIASATETFLDVKIAPGLTVRDNILAELS